jgi:hypothetical protein
MKKNYHACHVHDRITNMKIHRKVALIILTVISHSLIVVAAQLSHTHRIPIRTPYQAIMALQMECRYPGMSFKTSEQEYMIATRTPLRTVPILQVIKPTEKPQFFIKAPL